MGNFILSFIGSICPAILFNVNMKKAFWSGLSGVTGWYAYLFFHNSTGQVVFATFMGAIAVGFYSEIMARLKKCPSTVFSISGIFPLVPGIGAYQTVQLIVDNKLNEAVAKAVETLASAGSIALGIMMITAAFRIVTQVKHRIIQRR